MSRRLSLSPAQRAGLDVALRVTAAIFGGYVLTYAGTAALARLLPLARFDAVMLATLLSFTLYTGIVLWAFAAPSMRCVWLGIALSLPLAAIGFWPVWFGGAV